MLIALNRANDRRIEPPREAIDDAFSLKEDKIPEDSETS
jgi:hypothetical protein